MRWAAWTIAKREIKSLFVSPIAYVVLGIFALLSGIQFILSLERFDQALQQAKIQAQLMRNPEALAFINLNGMLISNVIAFGFFLLLFMIPSITMRLLCEEKNQGTYELLFTSPVSTWDIVLGKFIAAVSFFLLMLGTHALFLFAMFKYGNPEPGPIAAGYLGLFLTGAASISVGIFASALTKNQIVAYFISLFVAFILLMIGWGASSTSGNLSVFLEGASISTHFENMNKGVISVSSLVYFITLCVFFLTGSRISLESITRN